MMSSGSFYDYHAKPQPSFFGGCFTIMLRALPTYMFCFKVLGSIWLHTKSCRTVSIVGSFRGPISGGVSEMKVLSSVVFFQRRVRSTGVPWYGLDGWNPKQPLGMVLKPWKLTGQTNLSTGANISSINSMNSLPCGKKMPCHLPSFKGQGRVYP